MLFGVVRPATGSIVASNEVDSRFEFHPIVVDTIATDEDARPTRTVGSHVEPLLNRLDRTRGSQSVVAVVALTLRDEDGIRAPLLLETVRIQTRFTSVGRNSVAVEPALVARVVACPRIRAGRSRMGPGRTGRGTAYGAGISNISGFAPAIANTGIDVLRASGIDIFHATSINGAGVASRIGLGDVAICITPRRIGDDVP